MIHNPNFKRVLPARIFLTLAYLFFVKLVGALHACSLCYFPTSTSSRSPSVSLFQEGGGGGQLQDEGGVKGELLRRHWPWSRVKLGPHPILG